MHIPPPWAADTHRRHRTFLAAFLLSAVASADAIVALRSYAPAASSSSTTASATASAALPESTDLPSALLHPAAATASGVQAAGVWEAVAASTAANLGVGAAATMMGLVGCCVAHQLVNGEVEKRASESGVAATAAGGQGLGGQSTAGGSSSGVAAEGVLAGGALAVAAAEGGGVGAAATAAALGVGFAAGG